MPLNFNETKANENTASPVSTKINYLVGNSDIFETMKNTPVYGLFDKDIIGFLNNLSKVILHNTQAKKYPDVTTFAFWCRKSSIENMNHFYKSKENDRGFRIGRGIIFHIAPSNVAVNFAYSMVTGLLSGNANIVRLPSKEYKQVDIICEAINEALEKDSKLKPYLLLIKYGHDKAITDTLSILCDTRVIWGGNQTIYEIRQSPLKPRATEICFSDRYSISIINSDNYLDISDKKTIAQKFYNDTYLNDQNACTSPKLVVWMGNSINIAQDTFWKELHDLLIKKYELHAVQAVDKLNAFFKFAATKQDKYNAKFVYTHNDNLVTRVKVDSISEDLLDNEINSGFFIEYMTNDLKDILPVCRTELQTIGILGVPKETIVRFINKNRSKGIDRVVPIGSTLDFDLVWDGYDLITQLSREISIKV